jgi:hypothetical protein
LTFWCLGWLGLIVTYSGGGWAGDWIEHYERVRYFLEHWPRDTLFVGIYALPARPPLANLVVGAFQAMARFGFGSFQLFSCLFASLAFWPVCLCARRWGRLDASRAAAAAALALSLNPLFLQNATFAWTKLPAAFLILLGVYFYIEGLRLTRSLLCIIGAAVLGGAAITHYSTGPYLVGLAVAHLLLHRSVLAGAAFWRKTAAMVVAFAVLPATWFAWSLRQFGTATTLASNTTITGNPKLHVGWVGKALGNIYNTIVPHPVATEASGFMSQSSLWGGWRDFFFNIYQVNLPWAFGSVGFVLVLVGLIREWRNGRRGIRSAIALALLVTVITGIIVNGDLDPHGTTHLCLQAVILAGVAWIAAQWPMLSSAWRGALILGWTFDFAAGIALQFFNEGLLIDRVVHPQLPAPAVVATFSSVAQMNYGAKLYHHTAFVGETYGLTPGVLLIGLALLGAATALHARPAK